MYAVNSIGEIHVFDFSGRQVKGKIVLGEMRDYSFERVYIVETPCGDLLQIWSDIDRVPEVEAALEEPEPDTLEEDEYFSEPDLPPDYVLPRHKCTPFKLYRVDLTAGKLVEISDLGENVLFLGQNQTVCLNAQEHPQLKGNHIYFTDNDEGVAMCKNMTRDIGVFNLSDNRREKIVSTQIWSNWPNPVWVTPNLRKMNPDRGGSTQGTDESQAPHASCWPLGKKWGALRAQVTLGAPLDPMPTTLSAQVIARPSTSPPAVPEAQCVRSPGTQHGGHRGQGRTKRRLRPWRIIFSFVFGLKWSVTFLFLLSLVMVFVIIYC